MSSSVPVKQILETSADEIDLGALLRTLWRGKIWILLAITIAVIIGAYYAFVSATPHYKANAVVILNNQKEQVVDIESIMSGLSSDQTAINSEVEVMRSRGLIEKLVNELQLTKDPEFNSRLQSVSRFSVLSAKRFVRGIIGVVFRLEQTSDGPPSEREILETVIDEVRDAIHISNVRNSYVFDIIVTSEAALKSAQIANTLAILYIQNQLDVKFDATQQATSWLTERVGQLQVELEAAETKVKDFTSSTDLIDSDSLSALTRQLKELRDRKTKAMEQESTVGAQFDTLISISNTGTPTEIAKIAQDRTLSRLVEMLNTNEDANRDTFDARLGQILNTATIDRERASSQIVALDSSIQELQERIANQSDDLVKLQQLQRESEASRLIYEFFLGRLKETSAQQGILQADSRILSQAVPRNKATSPRKSMVLVLSIFLGGLFGSALVLLRELAQNTFRTAEELEARTGYTVIGQIPLIPARRRKNVLRYLATKPTSSAAESVRNLRTSILMSNVDKPPQIIMSTSSIPGEGKTSQSISLAQNLSGLGKKVLLLEGDIRRRVFAEYFDVKDKKGLLAVLSGDIKLEEATFYNEDLQADILIGEKSAVNAADIFSSDKFQALIAELREKYDYIIIDTPPVLAVPDARVIARLVDSIIYTVKWDSTIRRQVIQGLKSLEDVGIKASGLVLAQINSRGMKRYGYSDSYGSYSHYYDN